MVKKKKSCKTGWKVIVGGSSSVAGVKGCYKTKSGARAAIKRLREKRDIRISTIWLTKA